MIERMRYINQIEHESFSYRNFIDLMSKGTFRNKISLLLRTQRVYICKRSKPTYYSLSEYDLGPDRGLQNSMTLHHTGVSNSHHCHCKDKSNCKICNLSSFLDVIPIDGRSIHDLHLSFTVFDIWKILAASRRYPQNSKSMDIFLPDVKTNDLTIRVRVHHRDTVTVIVACSNNPIVLDANGIIRLSNALTRVEERLSRQVDECGNSIAGGYESIPIPENGRWKVTMRHYGFDSQFEYAGEKYALAWKDEEGVLVRKYAKRYLTKRDRKDKGDTTMNTSIREEIQEYPGKNLNESVYQSIKQE